MCRNDNFVYENEFAVQPYFGDPDYDFMKGDISKKDLVNSSSRCYRCSYTCWSS